MSESFKQLERVYAFRHGVYERNKLIDRTGDAARETIEIPDDADYVMDLLPEGEEQVDRLCQIAKLAGFAMPICLTSPYLRTRRSAARVLAGTTASIEPANGLREQDLGMFTNIPREVFYTDFAEEAEIKKRYPLYWKPKLGQSLLEVGQQVNPVLWYADQLGPEVAFSTSSGVMTAMRAMPELGGLGNEGLLRPLAPAIQNPLWIQNGQMDIYSWRSPDGKVLYDNARFFRSIALNDQPFDTGWIQLR